MQDSTPGWPMIPCGHCGGVGLVRLPKQLKWVLDTLGSTEMTTPDLIHAAKVSGEDVTIPAMCNRLKALEQFGLTSKRKSVQSSGGCWYIWRRSEGRTDGSV